MDAAITTYQSYVVKDPRSGQDVETTNPALIAYDLARQAKADIDVDAFIQAANFCESEEITVQPFVITGVLAGDLTAVIHDTPLALVADSGKVSVSFEKRAKTRKKLT
jgi:hypothetical protein